MKRRTLLATAALRPWPDAGGPAAFAQDKTEGLLRLCRPDRRRRLDLPAPSGPSGACEAEFGDKVETVYQENVPEGADAERVLTQMALSGCNIIFTTSFGYMDATNAVAAKFPNVKFEHATGFKREHAERLDLQRPLL